MIVEIRFCLNDETENIDEEEIKKHLHLFPVGILEAIIPFRDQMAKKTVWPNKSVLRVWQDGSLDGSYLNMPQEPTDPQS